MKETKWDNKSTSICYCLKRHNASAFKTHKLDGEPGKVRWEKKTDVLKTSEVTWQKQMWQTIPKMWYKNIWNRLVTTAEPTPNLIDKQQILHEVKSLFATIVVLHDPQQNMPMERDLVKGTSVVFCNFLCQNFPSYYSTATYGKLFSRETTLPYWALLPFSLGVTFWG